MERRVVVTGYGVVSPLGKDIDTFWNHIKTGKSGVKKIESDDFKEINTRIAGKISDFPKEIDLIFR